MKNSNWVESSIKVHTKSVHKGPVISISPRDRNLFYTSSEDKTMRLWDIRLHSSVRLFRNISLQSLSNCQNDHQHRLFVGSGRIVVAFDARKEDVFVEEIISKSEEPHYDDISFIRFDKSTNVLGVSDDEGDVRLYNSDLQCSELLDQGHSNIVNSLEFAHTEHGYCCITGGFDCKLIQWRLEDEQIVKEIDLQELMKKNEIKTTMLPFVHSINLHKTTIYVTTESGHVLAFAAKDFKKPKYIFQASLTRVVQSRIAQFNENILITLSRDGSFSLFDHTKRNAGSPLFLQKYKCNDEANWIETIQNNLLITNNLNCEIAFNKIK